jgi:hypothetical protein
MSARGRLLGKDVRLGAVSILHRTFSIEVTTSYAVSQPNALAGGQTGVIPQTKLNASESPARNVELGEGASVEQLVTRLQAIGATARDVVSILQAIKAAGALEADLEVINFGGYRIMSNSPSVSLPAMPLGWSGPAPAAALTRGAKAAREFESPLIGSLLDSLEKTFATVPGETDVPGQDEYSYLGRQALASAVSAAGGFGIAKMISEGQSGGLRNSSTKVTGRNLTVSGLSLDRMAKVFASLADRAR